MAAVRSLVFVLLTLKLLEPVYRFGVSDLVDIVVVDPPPYLLSFFVSF